MAHVVVFCSDVHKSGFRPDRMYAVAAIVNSQTSALEFAYWRMIERGRDPSFDRLTHILPAISTASFMSSCLLSVYSGGGAILVSDLHNIPITFFPFTSQTEHVQTDSIDISLSDAMMYIASIEDEGADFHMIDYAKIRHVMAELFNFKCTLPCSHH
jgi:hypothetical protein